MALPFIRGGSPIMLAGRRPSMKQLGKSPIGTDWMSYSASWSGSCAQPCAATRVMLFGGSSGESNAHSVIVAGDDLGDLSAFAAAFELKARGGDVLRVAVDSAEAPPALIDQADVIVDGPAGLLEFLRRLLV